MAVTEIAEGKKGVTDERVRKEQRRRSPLCYKAGKKMVYNPDWHYRHARPVGVQETAYMVQHYRWGQVRALALDIGRTDNTVRTTVQNIRKEGLWDVYMELDIEAFLEQLAEEEAEFLERTGFCDITEEPNLL